MEQYIKGDVVKIRNIGYKGIEVAGVNGTPLSTEEEEEITREYEKELSK